jgi:spore coat polysaccharide biosynthesis protein SpsF (cytidylyltransferase family)
MDEQNSDMKKLELPRYRCHKEVWALKIKDMSRQDGPGDPADSPAILTFEEAGYDPIRVSADFMFKHGPKPGGYLVVYEDGYRSFSPARAFEAGYTKVEWRMDPVDRIDRIDERRPRVGCIIQARLDSTRLCHKVFREIGDHIVLDWVLIAAAESRLCNWHGVRVVTPNQVIATYVEAVHHEIAQVWRGPRDPLGEYCRAARWSQYETIVRLTADCPMITGPVIDAAVEEFLASGADYGYNHKDGADVEVFTFEALAEAHEKAGPDEREHVTTWIRRNKRCVDLTPPAGEFLSLNTAAEYERICRLMKRGPD